jgi:hypothetical protein
LIHRRGACVGVFQTCCDAVAGDTIIAVPGCANAGTSTADIVNRAEQAVVTSRTIVVGPAPRITLGIADVTRASFFDGLCGHAYPIDEAARTGCFAGSSVTFTKRDWGAHTAISVRTVIVWWEFTRLLPRNEGLRVGLLTLSRTLGRLSRIGFVRSGTGLVGERCIAGLGGNWALFGLARQQDSQPLNTDSAYS